MSAAISQAAASLLEKQSLRLTRFGLAALSYAIGTGLATSSP